MRAFDSPADVPAMLASLGPRPVVACHDDADGLSSGAIMLALLQRAGLQPEARIVGRGENAWSPAFRDEMTARQPDGLVIADLGVAEPLPAPSVPTLIVDHHVPTGHPPGATVVSGIDLDPVPTSSLLAYRCAVAAGHGNGLLWLAAIGVIGDMAEQAGFPEMAEARGRYGITALRQAAALVNTARRAPTGDARPALDLLLAADGPRTVLDGSLPQTAVLLEAREAVQQALAQARRAPPRIVGTVALIVFSSPCLIHPLIAQQWRGRLKDRIVIAANVGFRPGFVHFAARTALDADLIVFFAEHRPPGADEQYGKGHRAASGGALRDRDWAAFLQSLGFATPVEAAS